MDPAGGQNIFKTSSGQILWHESEDYWSGNAVDLALVQFKYGQIVYCRQGVIGIGTHSWEVRGI